MSTQKNHFFIWLVRLPPANSSILWTAASGQALTAENQKQSIVRGVIAERVPYSEPSAISANRRSKSFACPRYQAPLRYAFGLHPWSANAKRAARSFCSAPPPTSTTPSLPAVPKASLRYAFGLHRWSANAKRAARSFCNAPSPTSTAPSRLARRSKSFASLRIWTPPLECKREARSA
jgi:hypothetical protein